MVLLIISGYEVKAQSGDQILDGIGETDMVARYIFDGNAKDWSRNTLHGTPLGDVKFVHDSRFGNVLSLHGTNAAVSLPGEVLTDLESISVSAWINLSSDLYGQYLFDFGKDADHHFFASPTGTGDAKLFKAGIFSSKPDSKCLVSVAALPTNKWVHLVIVADIPSGKIISYLNGRLAGETKGAPKELNGIFSPQSQKNQLCIGKSLAAGNNYLNALIHDFRIYRVALNSNQVKNIYGHTLNGSQPVVNVTAKSEDDLPRYSSANPQLYNARLLKVADVTVETEQGSLPRLPDYLQGTYKNGLKGPKVRVLWPNPTNTDSVQQTGSYVVKGRIPGTSLQPKAIVTVKAPAEPVVLKAKLEPFRLDQVSLNTDIKGHQTKFIENRDKFLRTLAKTDPNSFLYMFRETFGQKQPAGTQPLGVWDSQDTKLRGHATGHYLTAIAQAYASTGYDKALQANFEAKMKYMVNTLYDLSQLSGKAKNEGGPHVSDPNGVPVGPGKSAYDSDLTDQGLRTDYWNWGEGYISAYPPDQFIMLEHGAKYGGQNTQIWAPYYTLHKILAGLLDIYEVTGNKKALAIATGMGDWVYARLSKLPQDTLIKMWNTYIAGEYGGMNEVMSRMYLITNNDKYLKTAQRFDNIRVFFGDKEHSSGLVKNVDNLRGLHANQHIPQIIGSVETYKASNNPEYFEVADNFWHKAVSDYMYSIGGVAGARNPANAECFVGEPATLYQNGFSAGGQNETCATYNMLKLTDDLFMYTPKAELMDYYERALYNHILASVAKDNAGNTYHVPLRPGSIKQFSNADMTGFTCCNGTALESSTKLQNTIYFKSTDNQSLYVNLYIPSTLNWTEKNMVIQQTTAFPKDDHTRFIFKGNGRFDLYVRVPGWATKGFYVKINGREQKLQATPGSYLKISRNWKSGDTIDLKIPFQFHLDPVMDQQNIASLFYGPILLAAQEPGARKDWRKVTLNAYDISKSIKGNPKELKFTIDGVVFKPFYDSYGRHSVYMDVKLK